ncbi:MAG: carboxylating nicotinate-nucleotide diphosphorylase [Planctomycetia bacterium]|nr:carboxylating nicotinate-nucleotide diphosphorylase [Planctomycetia bacterium]
MDYPQISWDDDCRRDCLELVRLAVREDLGSDFDYTTLALVPDGARGAALVVARKAGVVCGLPAAALVVDECDRELRLESLCQDGGEVTAGETVARLAGPARSLLTVERILLNFLGRLSGVASLTRRYVQAVAGTGARIYDTRKTTPGWRRLEKYAVRSGGGCNHRFNLASAVLIKDNHLFFGAMDSAQGFSSAEAVQRARSFLAGLPLPLGGAPWIVEIEVDTREQIEPVLAAGPDLVLLDNMTLDELRQAVAIRNARNPRIELEASGGIDLSTVRAAAETGVERISVGALTHGATWLDVGMDWE